MFVAKNARTVRSRKVAYVVQGSYFLACKKIQDFPGPPKRFSRTLS